MKRIFLITVACLFATVVFSDEPDEILHNKCIYPVIEIYTPSVKGTGTGFIVRSEKVGDKFRNVSLTCGHLFTRSDQVIRVPKYKEWSTFDGYDEYECLVYSRNTEEDMAVVLFESEREMPVAEIDFESKVYIGSDIFRVGCGLGDEPRLDYGKITSVNTEAPTLKLNVLRTNIYTVLGDSGAPIYHKNKVIAITHSIRAHRLGPLPLPVFGISYGLPIGGLKKWDKDLNNVIGFAYDDSKPIPVLPFEVEKAAKVELDLIPKTHWSK